jgi:deoxyribodipyrimidine photo-lyase
VSGRRKAAQTRPVVLWLRNALRLRDNPALEEAIRVADEAGGPSAPAPIIPVAFPDLEGGRWTPGPASRWWLERSLESLNADLRTRGSRLVVRGGPAATGLPALVAQVDAGIVVADRRWEPERVRADEALFRALAEVGVELRRVSTDLLFDPEAVRTRDGRPFTTFTPYWRACLRLPRWHAGAAPPARLSPPPAWPDDERGERRAGEDRASEIRAPRDGQWEPGEVGAERALAGFIVEGLADYSWARERPYLGGTSRLSPHLHFGEISPREVWSSVEHHAQGDAAESADVFLKELVWREFAHHLLHHQPHTPERPLSPRFEHFPWENDPEGLEAWQHGATGYPIVDAGMRQLEATGWMHNRVRMIVASFLVKDLLLPWQEGADWFWRHLVDADLANNTLGWQWAAGSGADAAPYFRVFNPVLQGERYDPDGVYVRRWIPELQAVPGRWVHKPWEAAPGVLQKAGIRLGNEYPLPLVDHKTARVAALAAWRSIKDP